MTDLKHPNKSWRDILPVHPAADLFPLMSESELRDLGKDIKKNGLVSPIILWRDDYASAMLLDGRNRLDAMELAGISTVKDGKLSVAHHIWSNGSWVLLDSWTEAIRPVNKDPYTYVLSLNINRRHLTTVQKRDLIAKLLKARPEASNLQIAEQTKSDDKTVAKVRHKLESTSEIPKLEKTVGKDGKARKLPAKRKRLGKEEKDFHEKHEAREAKMQADRLADHPGSTVEDFKNVGICSDNLEGEAAFRDWTGKRVYYEPDVIDTPSGPMPEAPTADKFDTRRFDCAVGLLTSLSIEGCQKFPDSSYSASDIEHAAKFLFNVASIKAKAAA